LPAKRVNPISSRHPSSRSLFSKQVQSRNLPPTELDRHARIHIPIKLQSLVVWHETPARRRTAETLRAPFLISFSLRHIWLLNASRRVAIIERQFLVRHHIPRSLLSAAGHLARPHKGVICNDSHTQRRLTKIAARGHVRPPPHLTT
jgi:hypothetical protein